jgi:hypothetical protein
MGFCLFPLAIWALIYGLTQAKQVVLYHLSHASKTFVVAVFNSLTKEKTLDETQAIDGKFSLLPVLVNTFYVITPTHFCIVDGCFCILLSSYDKETISNKA